MFAVVSSSDPMHCLWLGVTKHLVELFKEEGFLKDSDMKQMETYINKLGTNRSYGRMRYQDVRVFTSYGRAYGSVCGTGPRSRGT
jgi:hypothetical protein